MITRREWLYGKGMVAGAAATAGAAVGQTGARGGTSEASAVSEHHPLLHSEFRSKSILQVQESRVERSRFPVIDFHTHITRSAKTINGVSLASKREYLGKPYEFLAVMDRRNVRAIVNLTGGYDQGLRDTVAKAGRSQLPLNPRAGDRAGA